jgi:formate hydrogenlyase transcriptional activator
MPPSLLESELLGHERGAFTGAHERRAGRFEQAHQGTLFLDEIGDLPPDAQAKLLRVLQDGQVWRLGATKPIAVDVRVVAATNRNLAARVEDGSFRADLFYRLSVFPIRLPPLRERREDIALLVEHFLEQHARRQHTAVPALGADVMAQLEAHEWPGNVRELQNVIERGVILAKEGTIKLDMLPRPLRRKGPLRAPARSGPRSAPAHPPALSDVQRQAIVDALTATDWRVSGADGAAARLGLKPTTLHSKMKKLGIRRPAT